jgi:WD domain, G-beta repeat
LLWDVFTEKPLARLPGHRGAVNCVAFSPDGKRLLSGGRFDTTILVWDVSPWTVRVSKVLAPLGKEAEQLWQRLAHEDPREAYSAMSRFLQEPAGAVKFLGQKLTSPPGSQSREIAKLIADLDNGRFADREKAMSMLQKLGMQAQSALERALVSNPPLEVRQRLDQLLSKLEGMAFPVENLRALRAFELLEMIATDESLKLLEALSKGSPDLWEAQEAAASLERLQKRRLVRAIR